MRGISFEVSPIPDHAFFEETVLERQLGHHLLQSPRLPTQILDLIARGLTHRVASQALLAGLQELLRPAVIKVLDDALAPAQLGDTVLAAQPIEHDADLLLRREPPACCSTDLLDDRVGRLLRRHQCLSHLSFLTSYDEPEPLPSSTC